MSTLRLPHALSDSDRLVVSGDMSAALTKYEEVEAEKKQITSGYTKQLKELRTLMHSLNVSLTTGTIERETEVEDVEDLFAGKVRTIRKDTGETVKERALDPEERQMKLGDSVVEGGRAIDLASERRKRDLTEEQEIAEDPEHAEEIRRRRLADEQADRDAEPPKRPALGDDIEVFSVGVWIAAKVSAESSTSFAVKLDDDDLEFDFDEHGTAWRWPPSWSDVVEASQEKARADEIARLAAEQAADAAKSPKALLKAPRGHKSKANGKAKKNSIVDQHDKPIPIPPDEPDTLCLEACEKPHQHTAERTPF